MEAPALALNLSSLEDHLAAPRGRGRLSEAPHFGTAGGAACGDTVRVAVSIEGDAVRDAGFEDGGCAAARAAANAAVELLPCAPPLAAARDRAVHIAQLLGGLTPEPQRLARLAATALD